MRASYPWGLSYTLQTACVQVLLSPGTPSRVICLNLEAPSTLTLQAASLAAPTVPE